jgi:hypothetical protein
VPIGRRVLTWLGPILLLAALVTTIDLLLSARLGLLANPLLYDGLFYLVEERLSPGLQLVRPTGQPDSPYWEVDVVSTPAIDVLPMLGLLRKHAPLWNLLIGLGHRLFGAGEWPAYTARFWPIGLLLVIVFLAVRRHSTAGLAWIVVLVTCMLPAVSVSVRSATYERFISQTVDFGREWFRADLRPDFALAVALLATVFVFFEWLAAPSRRTAVLLGGASALTILTKPSIFPVVFAIFGLLAVYGVIARRRAALEDLRQVGIAASVSLLVLLPWIVAGGLGAIVDYIVINATTMSPLWIRSEAGPRSPLTQLASFARFADSMMGSELWIVIGAGLLLFLVSRAKRWPLSPRLGGYAVTGLAALVIVALVPFVTSSLGMFSALMLWTASWCLLAQAALCGLRRVRVDPRWLVPVASAYPALLVAGAWCAYASWPAYGREVGPTNREATRRIVEDVARVIKPDDVLTSVEIWAYPMSIAYELAHAPRLFMTDGMYLLVRSGVPPEALGPELLADCGECSVVLALDLDSVSDAPNIAGSPTTWPYLDAVARWVKSPSSPYLLTRAYPIAADPFTSLSSDEEGRYAPSVLLFVRGKGRSLPELGFVDPHDGILPGAGWQAPESAGGERFRWAGDDVELVLSPTDKRSLTLDVEPGPAISGAPLELSVVANDGSAVRLASLATRQAVTIDLPAASTTKRVLRLRVDTPGPRQATDGRVLSFRLFDAFWSSGSDRYTPATLRGLSDTVDIGPPDDRRALAATGTLPVDGLFTGYGWHRAEQSGVDVFRWVANDAEIVVARPSGERRELELQLEPGPGVGLAAFDLHLVDEGGAPVGAVRVRGRETVRVPLPIRPGVETQTFRLRVEGGSLPTPNDARILNFRLFSMRWSGSGESAGPVNRVR